MNQYQHNQNQWSGSQAPHKSQSPARRGMILKIAFDLYPFSVRDNFEENRAQIQRVFALAKLIEEEGFNSGYF